MPIGYATIGCTQLVVQGLVTGCTPTGCTLALWADSGATAAAPPQSNTNARPGVAVRSPFIEQETKSNRAGAMAEALGLATWVGELAAH